MCARNGMCKSEDKKGCICLYKSTAGEVKAIPPPIASLVEKAQSLIVQCDYELAKRFVHRVLEREPNHAEAKDMLGVVQLETGELDEARIVSLQVHFMLQHHDAVDISWNMADVRVSLVFKSSSLDASSSLRTSLSCTAER